MDRQTEMHQLFDNFPYALYALDVKFQPAFRPGGRFGEQMRYFSGKHKLYGFKIECAVIRPGIAVHVSRHYPGSTSDLNICLKNLPVHQDLLRKTEHEITARDYGERSSEYPGSWGVLVDKGYQGLPTHLRCIHPKRKPRGAELTHDEHDRNKRVSHDRVLVENYFGRLSTLWRVMFATFKWSEDKYDHLTRICVALTNFHAVLRPLRAQDSTAYAHQLSRYMSMAQRQRRRLAQEDIVGQARRVQARHSLDAASPAPTSMDSPPQASPADHDSESFSYDFRL
jgi:hypothetical protein